MKVVRDKEVNIFDVKDFETVTDKKEPYFQNGRRYAICPNCGSAVQIIGGEGGLVKSKKARDPYAVHVQNPIEGLPFDKQKYKKCMLYIGNQGNWQQIYNATAHQANEMLERYILDNTELLASQLSDLTGIRFLRIDGKQTLLYRNMLESFMSNGGLRQNTFWAEYVPRLILKFSGPVGFWGNQVEDEAVLKRIENTDWLNRSLVGKQLKPCDSLGLKLVADLDDISVPKKLLINLVAGSHKLEIKRIPAMV